MGAPSELKYEDALRRLEKLVQELDQGELDLEARLKKFEEGTRLARLLFKRLEQAKRKVQMLAKTTGGESTAVPFDADSHDDRPED